MKRFVVLAGLVTTLAQAAPDTTFSYQGVLRNNGQPAEGLFDFFFELHTNNVGGTATALATNLAVGVTNGLFTALLDMGTAFDAQPHWLAISVRTNGGGSFTSLSGRQRLSPSPKAIHSIEADTAQVALAAQSSAINSAAIQDGVIVNVDIATNAAIADGKLATIATAGKVANSATTATSSNVPNTIVLRNGDGDFAAGLVSSEELDVTGYFRSGVETGAGEALDLPGLIIRRLESTNNANGVVIARINSCRLIRDGTIAGLRIAHDASNENLTVNAIGLSFYGTNVNVRLTITTTSTGSVQLFSNAQRIVHAQISMGNVYDRGNMTHVVLDRFDNNTINDYFMIGTITSTYNQ